MSNLASVAVGKVDCRKKAQAKPVGFPGELFNADSQGI
jgi:hypothetical protein